MSEQSIITMLEIALLAMCFVVEIPLVKKMSLHKNRMNVVLMIMLTGFQIISVLRIVNLIYVPFNFTIGVSMNLLYLFILIVLCIQVEFLLYLKKAQTLYSLPIIAAFYVGFGLVLVDSEIALITFSLVAGFTTFALLLQEGKKNQNGLVIALGIFILLNTCAEIMSNAIYTSITRVISMTILYLGTSDFIDKFLSSTKQEEQKIKNVWISRMVAKDN